MSRIRKSLSLSDLLSPLYCELGQSQWNRYHKLYGHNFYKNVKGIAEIARVPVQSPEKCIVCSNPNMRDFLIYFFTVFLNQNFSFFYSSFYNCLSNQFFNCKCNINIIFQNILLIPTRMGSNQQPSEVNLHVWNFHRSAMPFIIAAYQS